ncbi:MAG: hypothetical protein FJX72_04615 [Armatimonadetes bacterium]|nr:hypothetical protein [Armatimonadota bacterium]
MVVPLAGCALAGALLACILPLGQGTSNEKDDGYRGIWFTLGQYQSEFGDKYSGGLGTYTANHVPIAVYSARAHKTFFVWGGAKKGTRHLLIMASYYDHRRGVVPRPTIVCPKLGVNDPHDNAAICLDDRGYVWVFVSGRGRTRPGFKYRSTQPYSTEAFELVSTEEMTYPQPSFAPGRGFFHLFTKYTKGRELYWQTSADGRTWSEGRKLAGIEGHYQVSCRRGNTIVSAFMRHPGGSVDKRTDLYVVRTDDLGDTWTTLDGRPLTVPLSTADNPARVRAYSEEGRLVYINDVNFDARGNPIVLYVVSKGSEPGPKNGPRLWTIAHWTGRTWSFHDITTCTHNYDMGSLYIEGRSWRVIGPTEPGPQEHGTGGEMAAWTSRDEGKTWQKAADLTSGSPYNHSYARRPLNAHPAFYALWADGHAFEESPSRLYFTNRACDAVWMLPEKMDGEFARPQKVFQKGRARKDLP